MLVVLAGGPLAAGDGFHGQFQMPIAKWKRRDKREREREMWCIL